jgi:Cys-tRNA(Pro)/Cys-tRNA(Cys) deacylase
MAKTTPATKALDALKLPYELHTYPYEAGPDVGARAAAALGVTPDRVLKTLMVKVDGKACCIITPSDGEVSMKKVAAAFGGKSAAMMPVPEAEKSTGYVVGGISALGQRKKVATLLNVRAMEHDRVFCNGGGRGLQILIAPADLQKAAEASLAELD